MKSIIYNCLNQNRFYLFSSCTINTTAETYLYIFQRGSGVLAVYYLPKFDISLQCCYSWHTSIHNIIKLYQSQNCNRIIAQEIKFWSKYPSLCYITTTELRWEISNFNSYIVVYYITILHIII